jgi:acetyl-CoA synthetase (ADP-forming)
VNPAAKKTSQEIIAAAKSRGQEALTEYESKQVLAAYGIPVTREALVDDLAAATSAAAGIGWPLVLKACAHDITHKTERGLVQVGISNVDQLRAAWKRMRTEGAYDGAFLLQEMVGGARELVLGLIRDPQMGPSVMFGIGGIFTEVFEDVVFRVAPLSIDDALQMTGEIRGAKILDAVRGMPEADRGTIAAAAVALGQIGMDHDDVQEIDINPLILNGSLPVAVDGLIVLNTAQAS